MYNEIDVVFFKTFLKFKNTDVVLEFLLVRGLST